MADLDDFFAKRDKKKKSSKTKFSKIDTEEFAKHLEAVASQASTLVLDEPVQNTSSSNQTGAISTNTSTAATTSNLPVPNVTPIVPTIQDESDILDDETDDSNRQHVTNLRVNVLKEFKAIDTQMEPNQQQGENKESETKKQGFSWTQTSKQIPVVNKNQDESDSSPIKEVDSKPTQATTITTSSSAGSYVPPHLRKQQQQQQQQQQETPTVVSNSTSTGGAYVPPHLRGTQQSTTSAAAPISSSRRWKKNEPNINDVSEFPSLGDMQQQQQPSGLTKSSIGNKESNYEQPKKSGRTDYSNSNQSNMELNNKFDALSS